MTQNVSIKGNFIEAVRGGRLFSAVVYRLGSNGLDMLIRTAAGSTPTMTFQIACELGSRTVSRAETKRLL